MSLDGQYPSFIEFQGRGRLRGRVRPSTTTTTTTTTTPVPIYEEEYDDYEQYEEYNYNDEDEEVEGGWEKAREMLEEEVFAFLHFCIILLSYYLGRGNTTLGKAF